MEPALLDPTQDESGPKQGPAPPVVQKQAREKHLAMSEAQHRPRCHGVTIPIVTLMVSGLVNIITITLLCTWECPQEPVRAQEVHDVHRNADIIMVDDSLGDDDSCICPDLA